MVPLLATKVATEIEVSGAAYALEIGGLMFLMAGLGSILVGLWKGDDSYVGGRAVGYGVAITAAAGLSLYIAVQIGGDPVSRAAEASWLYPLVAIAGCLLYVSRTINASVKSGRRNHRARNEAIAELNRGGRAPGHTQYTRPARNPRAQRRSRPSARP
jgi:hypothetical protein